MVPHPSLGVEAQTFDLEGHLVDADLKRENVVDRSDKLGGLEDNAGISGNWLLVQSFQYGFQGVLIFGKFVKILVCALSYNDHFYISIIKGYSLSFR